MKKIEVFFDLICPYCYKGVFEFLDVLSEYPHVEVVWQPCESHPKPENHNPHSDIAIHGLMSLAEQKKDVEKYIRLVYQALFKEKKDIEDVSFIAELGSECGGSKEQILEDLKSGRFEKELQNQNRYAWIDMGLEAVPSYACDGKQARSTGGVLVDIEEVKNIMK